MLLVFLKNICDIIDHIRIFPPLIFALHRKLMKYFYSTHFENKLKTGSRCTTNHRARKSAAFLTNH